MHDAGRGELALLTQELRSVAHDLRLSPAGWEGPAARTLDRVLEDIARDIRSAAMLAGP